MDYFLECIEQLRVLSLSPQPILQSIGVGLGLALSSLVPVLANQLFGGESSSERAAAGRANQLADLEGQALQQRMDLVNLLQELIQGGGANPNVFRLPRGAGDDSNLEQFLGGIDFETAREIEQLMGVLGQVPTSTGVSQQLLAEAGAQGRERRGALGDLSGNLVQIILSRLMGNRNQGVRV